MSIVPIFWPKWASACLWNIKFCLARRRCTLATPTRGLTPLPPWTLLPLTVLLFQMKWRPCNLRPVHIPWPCFRLLIKSQWYFLGSSFLYVSKCEEVSPFSQFQQTGFVKYIAGSYRQPGLPGRNNERCLNVKIDSISLKQMKLNQISIVVIID